MIQNIYFQSTLPLRSPAQYNTRETRSDPSELLGFWTLSIVRHSKEHKVSETGFDSVHGFVTKIYTQSLVQ
jgi:hypothetical protein